MADQLRSTVQSRARRPQRQGHWANAHLVSQSAQQIAQRDQFWTKKFRFLGWGASFVAPTMPANLQCHIPFHFCAPPKNGPSNKCFGPIVVPVWANFGPQSLKPKTINLSIQTNGLNMGQTVPRESFLQYRRMCGIPGSPKKADPSAPKPATPYSTVICRHPWLLLSHLCSS